jgi:hypothetical protein
VVRRWVDKAFRFTDAGAGGDQGVCCQAVAGRTLPGLALVCVSRMVGLEGVEKVPADAVMPEGQADLQIRAIHPGRFVLDEAAHHPMKEAVGRLEAGDQELFDALLNVVCQEGGGAWPEPFEAHYRREWISDDSKRLHATPICLWPHGSNAGPPRLEVIHNTVESQPTTGNR